MPGFRRALGMGTQRLTVETIVLGTATVTWKHLYGSREDPLEWK